MGMIHDDRVFKALFNPIDGLQCSEQHVSALTAGALGGIVREQF
jgi:hypothetical protein